MNHTLETSYHRDPWMRLANVIFLSLICLEATHDKSLERTRRETRTTDSRERESCGLLPDYSSYEATREHILICSTRPSFLSRRDRGYDDAISGCHRESHSRRSSRHCIAYIRSMYCRDSRNRSWTGRILRYRLHGSDRNLQFWFHFFLLLYLCSHALHGRARYRICLTYLISSLILHPSLCRCDTREEKYKYHSEDEEKWSHKK